MNNIHVDTTGRAPPGTTDLEKVLYVVRWWHRLAPEIRKRVIEDIEGREDYWCNPTDGWLVALLNGLEDTDPKGLQRELEQKGIPVFGMCVPEVCPGHFAMIERAEED